MNGCNLQNCLFDKMEVGEFVDSAYTRLELRGARCFFTKHIGNNSQSNEC